jgi:hypothetical protein
MRVVANDGSVDRPSILQQMDLLEVICMAAEQARIINNTLASELLDFCYETIKDQVTRPSSSCSMANQQAVAIVQNTLLSLLGENKRNLDKSLSAIQRSPEGGAL